MEEEKKNNIEYDRFVYDFFVFRNPLFTIDYNEPYYKTCYEVLKDKKTGEDIMKYKVRELTDYTVCVTKDSERLIVSEPYIEFRSFNDELCSIDLCDVDTKYCLFTSYELACKERDRRNDKWLKNIEYMKEKN